MADRLNSEFNYRYQVIGETPWAKIKTLKGFLEGRQRAAIGEKVNEMKMRSLYEELNHLKEIGALPHVIRRLEIEIIESESFRETEQELWNLNRKEIECLQNLLQEMYIIAEPTRLKHDDGTYYTDDEMFEANAAAEFTMETAKQIQAEIIATGHPAPATIRHALSNPHTYAALKSVGLIPAESRRLGQRYGNDVSKIELVPLDEPVELQMLLAAQQNENGVVSEDLKTQLVGKEIG